MVLICLFSLVVLSLVFNFLGKLVKFIARPIEIAKAKSIAKPIQFNIWIKAKFKLSNEFDLSVQIEWQTLLAMTSKVRLILVSLRMNGPMMITWLQYTRFMQPFLPASNLNH